MTTDSSDTEQHSTSEVNENDLLGGLDVETSEDISVPQKLVNQVIGQEHARNVVKKAARQKRHVLMMGSPGTGKSMLAKAMSEMLPREEMQDILLYPNDKDENQPKVRQVEAGKGQKIIDAHLEEAQKQNRMRRWLMWIVILVAVGYALFSGQFLLGVIAAAIIFVLFRYFGANVEANAPELLIDNSDQKRAPFRDATGAHDGALLGDVRHDPYQSGQMATPPHQRVESGAIQEAHKGVLFLDEINTLDIKSQQKLMTAIQDGEYSITGQSDRSSGSMVQTESVPCDFVMVAAGNMDALQNMHPALRDRLQGYGYEVYMNDTVEDTQEMRRKYVQFIAQEVDKESIPPFTADAMREIIREAQRRSGEKGKLTLKLRNLGGLIRVAGDLANEQDARVVTPTHVVNAKEESMSIEQQAVDKHIEKRKKYGITTTSGSEVGVVNGLAVKGETAGITLPIMADVTPAQGQGQITATGKLEEIAEESVENVSSIIKKLGGDSLDDKDVHIQFVQTHQGVDGDSASVTVATAVISALTGVLVKQDVAMTGSLSVRGDVLPVGGTTHKIEAAAKAGIDTVIIPYVNRNDIQLEDEYKDQIEIIPAKDIGDVLEHALDADKSWIQNLTDKLKKVRNSGIGNLGIKNTTENNEPAFDPSTSASEHSE